MVDNLDEAKRRKSHKEPQLKADLEEVLKKLAAGEFPKYNRTETLRDFGKAKSFSDGVRAVVKTMIRLSGASPNNDQLLQHYELAIIQHILKG
ncbi:hypothetical protein SP15_020 [Bacillus phage SP-15]|uniref:Uncharacterized protein n=1 Tax=Bacillus phage SP-15 TaxID=1792032 RepID=A0A127AVY3_9CAUD|nr:hypothetical protein SP15_020 [Bacillus phage SP-15]AMM44819.1 hypothetical protein SP15_020 [Bacillus phage SP-15]